MTATGLVSEIEESELENQVYSPSPKQKHVVVDKHIRVPSREERSRPPGVHLSHTRPNIPPPPKRSSFSKAQLPVLASTEGSLGSFSCPLEPSKLLDLGPKRSSADQELDECGDDSDEKLSKAAKVLEEDHRKVRALRSLLLNFLEDRDCSIKKRLDLNSHQTETGRPVTDAVVQEVCKLRPDMIGLSLRDCREVTDVGLWCIARHTTALRELDVSGCHSVTNVGLRSLALRGETLERLDFAGCTNLTDLGLRVLGGGCWSLRSLSLERCNRVSDTGVSEVARLCTGLTYLNVSSCERVGEYGDRALIQLGRSCHELRRLDAFGCSHAQDPGLLAIAQGCPKLEKLMLTGCGEITGQSVRALARRCRSLTELSLSGCGNIRNRDLAHLAQGCTRLKHLNIAHCAQVDAQGLSALAGGLKNLTELDVGGCEKVDDAGLQALTKMNAHFLNLEGCQNVTEVGISHIAHNCTALSNLNVTGCPRVTRKFIMELCFKMRLCEPAHAYFGFQPRKDARKLLARVEAENKRIGAALVIQRHMRGKLARGRAHLVKRRGRVHMRKIRAERARMLLLQAREQAKRELAALQIQSTWRGHAAQRVLMELKRLRGEALEEGRAQREAVTLIQSIYRMREGRRVLQGLKDERDLLIKQWETAVKVQAIWRTRRAKTLALVLRAIQEEARRQAAAITIQAFWRYVRAVHLAQVQRAMFKIRQMQGGAARDIQRVYRGFKGRLRAKARKGIYILEREREAATMTIQRVYRGHKGRERFECKQHLVGLEKKARPLQFKLDELTQSAKKIADRLKRLRSSAGPIQAEKEQLAEELFHILNTKDKYTDSDKISGIRQRFLTKFLHVRLVELQKAAEKKLEKLEGEMIELEVKERHNVRMIRQTERELLPLGRGTVEKVKLLRRGRLRHEVRSQRAGATTIQRVFRGWRVRKAVFSWYRDYWEEVEDQATGDVYYINTWTEETRWVRPLEISIFEDISGRAGAARQLDDADEADGGVIADGGSNSVKSRVSRRLEELMKETTAAAEEEASAALRDIRSTGTARAGGATGGSWVPVDRVGSEALPHPCWYHTATMEHRWDDPAQSPRSTFVHAGEDGTISGPIPAAGRGGFFSTRKEGEDWLRAQSAEELVRGSEEVQAIGHTAWRELLSGPKAQQPPRGNFSPSSSIDLAGHDGISTGRQESKGDRVAESVSTAAVATLPLPFSFFHNRETGEVRWSLSPRTALESPRSPRRARLRRTGVAEDRGPTTPSASSPPPKVSEAGLSPGGLGFEGGDDEGGSPWSIVEDGDMVYYYNQRTRVSQWDPPDGWRRGVA